MAKSQPSKNVPATRPATENAMVIATQAVPDYIANGQSRGSENVGMDDLVIPRLIVLQELSPMCKRNDPKYNKDAAPGMLVNSVTGEIYGEEAHVVPVYYNKQWLVWRDQKQGGGFLGAFNSSNEAEARIRQEENRAGLEAIDTPQHLCLVLRPNGKLEEIMISLPKTKAKVSRNWNSMIKLAGGDSFSRVYKVTSVEESKNNNDFFNFDIKPIGFPSEPLYRAAEALYKKISSGERRIVVDHDDDAGANEGGSRL